MTENEDPSAKVPGIQLALFELVWSTFEGLTHIFVRFRPSEADVYSQFEKFPSVEDRADCERLLGEVFNVAFEGQQVECSFSFGTSAPKDPTYHQIFSENIFRQIAAEVAPWRLNASR